MERARAQAVCPQTAPSSHKPSRQHDQPHSARHSERKTARRAAPAPRTDQQALKTHSDHHRRDTPPLTSRRAHSTAPHTTTAQQTSNSSRFKSRPVEMPVSTRVGAARASAAKKSFKLKAQAARDALARLPRALAPIAAFKKIGRMLATPRSRRYFPSISIIPFVTPVFSYFHI